MIRRQQELSATLRQIRNLRRERMANDAIHFNENQSINMSHTLLVNNGTQTSNHYVYQYKKK